MNFSNSLPPIPSEPPAMLYFPIHAKRRIFFLPGKCPDTGA